MAADKPCPLLQNSLSKWPIYPIFRVFSQPRNTISDFSFPTWDDVVYEQLLCHHFHLAKYLWITTLSELLRIMLIKDQNVTQPAVFKHLPRYSEFGSVAFDISFCDHCDCLYFYDFNKKNTKQLFHITLIEKLKEVTHAVHTIKSAWKLTNFCFDFKNLTQFSAK